MSELAGLQTNLSTCNVILHGYARICREKDTYGDEV